jgi:hypothetical protein
MPNALRSLAKLTARQLLLSFWAAFTVIGLVGQYPPLSVAAAIVLVLLYCGYPWLIVLGLPGGVVRAGVVRWSRVSLVGFVVLLAVLAVMAPLMQGDGVDAQGSPRAAAQIFGAVFAVALTVGPYSQFFAGTAALNDVLAALNRRRPMDSIPNFAALFFWPIGGCRFVQPKIRAVFHAA